MHQTSGQHGFPAESLPPSSETLTCVGSSSLPRPQPAKPSGPRAGLRPCQALRSLRQLKRQVCEASRNPEMTRQSKTAELCLISTEQSPCYGWVEGLVVTRTQTPGGTRSCVPSANRMPASATDTAPVPAEITVHPRRIREEQRTVHLGRERKPPRNGGRRSTEAELGTGWTGRRELPPSRKRPGAVRPHTARRNDKDKDTEPGRPGCVGPVGALPFP